MDSPTVTRWQRYGKDRLYVVDAAGAKLGWFDLQTGASHPEVPACAAELDAAVQRWRAERNPGDQEPEPSPEPPAAADAADDGEPEPTPDEAEPGPAWDDLADRRAGAMAREQAVALRQAAPVRTLLARALRMRTDERAWRIGADGEERVAAQLAKLARKDPRWRVLHAVPVGHAGSDIDHVVVGPGGVFTLNAKHHPGATVWVSRSTVLVNGQRQPYLRNSAFEAGRAGRLLTAGSGVPVTATGVVVVVGATSVRVKERPPDVHVLPHDALVGWFRSRGSRLSDAAVDAVFDAARRSTTCQG